MKMSFVYGPALLIFALAGACASFPSAMKMPPDGSRLVSLSLDRDVIEQGAPERPIGFATDREAWNKPLDEAVQLWSETVAMGWESLYSRSATWRDDPASLESYRTLTELKAADSWFGFDQPNGIRYKVGSGWNYVAVGEIAKLRALSDAWKVPSLWSVASVAFYVREDGRADRPTYHLSVRNVVTLLGSDGAIQGRYQVISFSKSKEYHNLDACRRDLRQTLPEAGDDFVKKWSTLIQNE